MRQKLVHRRSDARAISALLLCFLLAAPTSGWAQGDHGEAGAGDQSPKMDEAKERFRVGLKLYDDGAYEAARVQFERAYELAPSYKLLYNIGLVYNQLHDFVGSLKACQRYLTEGGAEVPADRRAEITKLISDLKLIIASVTVATNVPGVEVSVDDAVVGKSPLSEPILLNPGRRKVSGKLEGRLPDAQVITVASGDKTEVKLNLVEPKRTVVNKGGDWKPVVAWVVTGALVAGTTVTGILTAKASSDLKDLESTRDKDGSLGQQLNDQHTKMKTFGLVTDILGACTIVSAGVAVYFTWFAPKDTGTPQTGKSSFDFGIGPMGGVVKGAF